MPRYDTSLFIFRRDLRMADNTALNEALRHSRKVIACFILDDRQIEAHAYQSKPALHFMMQSLGDLANQFESIQANLAFFSGLPVDVIETLYRQYGINAVFFNRDYTPFSRGRDVEIAQVCHSLQIDLVITPDALINEPEQAVKSDGSAYRVFTAFYNNARHFGVALPEPLASGTFLTVESTANLDAFAQMGSAQHSLIEGGRTQALKQLATIHRCVDYTKTRDFPALQSTSHFSAHLKFGTLSVREVFSGIAQVLELDHPLLRQLYWRDFMTHIAYHFPHVFGHAFIEKFDRLPWENNRDYFDAWTQGRTGFPIVDAGMRELNETGFMHNRVRMIVASFLTKDLRISWRWGERYFAQHLIDYDPCLNNGNWQWAASTGCDAQPYFRIFNPWLQQQKFDANGEYIYRWVPELRGVPLKTIHQWDKKHAGNFYPAPIVDHSKESQITKAFFKNAD
jgi:deoxyribodipyrimidine photo-lyase